MTTQYEDAQAHFNKLKDDIRALLGRDIDRKMVNASALAAADDGRKRKVDDPLAALSDNVIMELIQASYEKQYHYYHCCLKQQLEADVSKWGKYAIVVEEHLLGIFESEDEATDKAMEEDNTKQPFPSTCYVTRIGYHDKERATVTDADILLFE